MSLQEECIEGIKELKAQRNVEMFLLGEKISEIDDRNEFLDILDKIKNLLDIINAYSITIDILKGK